MKSRVIKQDLGIFEGSGNVFEDLNIPDAAEHDLKSQLAFLLNEAIKACNSSQAEIAKKLDLKQPNVSQLINYKLQGFSVERLMQFLVKLGHSLTIQVSDKRSNDACVTVVTRLDQGVVETAAFAGEMYDVNAICWYIGDTYVLQETVKNYPGLKRRHSTAEDETIVATPIERISANFTQAQRMRLQ